MKTKMTEVKSVLFQLFVLSCYVTTIWAMEDSKYWRDLAENEIEESLAYQWVTEPARNVIIFVGDGMSPDTITASRIYKAGEHSYLAWEKFPHMGLLKTYNTNKQVPDSASTATALFSGVKTNYEVVGVDANVPLADCEASLNTEYHVKSIISWAQSVGKDTGFVTTTRVTHATPAPLYAHCPDRRWECEERIPLEARKKCKDIARQLIEDEPGKNIKVILGGGRQVLQSNVTGTENDPIDHWACYSKDGRNLIEDWKRDKESRNATYTFVQNKEELGRINPKKTEYLLGIFANSHISMDYKRDKTLKGQPSLEEMTVAALKILRRARKGFVLMVEGGLIDFAHHRGHAAQALLETIRLSDAVNATLRIVDTTKTLIIVTSDHTHSLAFNGYSDRNSSILGIAQKSRAPDKTPYTTLTYSTGGPNNAAYTVNEKNESVRMDPSKQNTTDFNYSQQAAIITDEAYHGGGDVVVYAMGPFAHLFHTTHEQNYVPQVIAYAAKMGPYRNTGKDAKPKKRWYFTGVLAVVCSLFFSLMFRH